jgi:Bacterial Ig-like domain (group 2)
MPHSRSVVLLSLTLTLSLASAACLGGGGGRTSPPPVTVPEALAIQQPPTLHPGGTAQLRVVLVHPDRSGVDMTSGATWSSDNAGVATVSGAGVVTAVGPGTCTITARAGGRQATAKLTVQR